jgi:hypothetical protein
VVQHYSLEKQISRARTLGKRERERKTNIEQKTELPFFSSDSLVS